MLLVASVAAAGLLDDMGIDSEASRLVRGQDYRRGPSQRPPAQHSGAEGVPPLPLPVVPLRRTEKKNTPRPPVLIAKLATADEVDWATSPEDTSNLLRALATTMNVHFSTINLPLDGIPADATDIPVLYRSGIRAFTFTEQQRERLRQYLLGGGTLIFNAYCGHPDFARSAIEEMKLLIPERPPYRLAGDHPLYRAFADIKDIRYRPLALQAGARNGIPSAIGIDINTRTAVFLFRYDLSTAWDNTSSDAMHIIGYEPGTAQQLGANLMAYVTAERSAAIPLSEALLFIDANRTKAGKFAIAQARYDGLWRTRDNSLYMLLDVFHSQTQTPVRFAEETVDLSSPRVFDYPLVYLTGTASFTLTETERGNLRAFLSRGGVLLAEACCGRPSFDDAFRREMGRVLPNAKLERLPQDHVIFRFPHRVDQVTPRPALARRLNSAGRIAPALFGVSVEGRLAVIYSPFDLSGGWSLAHGPYNEGVASEDAIALGVNILAQALMQ
ncbi:MAG: DUF4159 domain-containing protein [Planctomycetes bacterium]|nr:DUF4159 domain-containing protein [Planctomycetota bacterium]